MIQRRSGGARARRSSQAGWSAHTIPPEPPSAPDEVEHDQAEVLADVDRRSRAALPAWEAPALGSAAKPLDHLAHRQLPAGRVGRHADGRPGQRPRAESRSTSPGAGGPSGDSCGLCAGTGRQRQPRRKLPQRPVADRQRPRERRRHDLAGDQHVVIAEDRVELGIGRPRAREGPDRGAKQAPDGAGASTSGR